VTLQAFNGGFNEGFAPDVSLVALETGFTAGHGGIMPRKVGRPGRR
jgi:hypothetical protein